MTDMEMEGKLDPMADPEEQELILSVLDSFRYDHIPSSCIEVQ